MIIIIIIIIIVLNTLIYTWTKVGIILEIYKNKSIRAEMKIKYKGIKIKN